MLLTMLIAASLVAQPAEADVPADLAPQVRKLLRQLDGSALKQREEAEAELIKLGPAILELLPADSDKLSVEQRERLSRVRLKLQKQGIEETAKATKLTLTADKKPLTEILAAIEKQTSNRLGVHRSLDDKQRPISVAWKDKPFWAAIDELCAKEGLTLVEAPGKEKWLLAPRPEGERAPTALSYSGPFRVEARRLSARRDLLVDETSLTVTLDASWEPRLAPVILQLPMSKVEAVDDTGKKHRSPHEAATYEPVISPGAASVEVEVPLPLPPRKVAKLASLKGQLVATIPGPIETFTFESLKGAKKVVQKKASATVTLDDVFKNDEVWEVNLTVRYEKADGALDSHRAWFGDNEAYLLKPDGERSDPAGLESAQGENEVRMTFVFEGGDSLDKHKFVYKAPGGIISVPVDFEIKDLELP